MVRFLVLACLVVAGCSTTTAPTGCLQPPQPTCIDRTIAWCTAATFRGTAEALGDAGVLVPCPDSAGNHFFATFDAGTLDDAGLPYGCPSLSTTPDLKSVLDAGVQNGASCCYPTRVYCS